MTSKKGPDLLLINPSTNEEVYGSLASKSAARELPFLAALAAGYVRKQGYIVELLDANVDGLGQGDTAEIVRDRNPGLVAIVAQGHQPSASSHLMRAIGKLCREIKGRSDIPILLTGNHPSSLPERTLREEECDYVVHGEVYKPMIALLGAINNGGVSNVPGLCYLDDGNFVKNKAASLITNLDEELSDVAWDLLPPFEKYRTHNWHAFENIDKRSPFGSFYTSLGCPFKCSFCMINSEFKASLADNKSKERQTLSELEMLRVLDETDPIIRFWSPDSAIKHFDYMVKNGVRHIKIIDEMFLLDKKHVNGIADRIIERGYGNDINIWAYARVDTAKDERLLEKLKKAGFNWLCIGIESANPEVRHGADKRFNNEKIFGNVKKIDDAGINVLGNYMVGLQENPKEGTHGDTRESMQETFNMAMELLTPWFNVYATMAYPGAPDYTLARQKGVQLPGDPDVPGGWTAYSHHSLYTLPLSTETLSAADVLRFRDKFYHNYILNPNYHKLIINRFGESAGRKIIDNLIGKGPIKRRLLENNPLVEVKDEQGKIIAYN